MSESLKGSFVVTWKCPLTPPPRQPPRMGSLAGHVLPGSLFLVFGVWWVLISIWSHLHRVCSSRDSRGKQRRDSTATTYWEYKQDHDLSRKSWLPQAFCNRFPLEPVVKIILPIIGVIAEAFLDEVSDDEGNRHLVFHVYRVRDDDGSFNNLGKLHHITMYSAFILSGVIDLTSLFIRFPKHTGQVFFSLAFCVEGILFYFHTASGMPLSAQVHGILTAGVFACALFAFLRVFRAMSLLVNIGLASAIIFQGTWFIQAGFILYPPGKDWRWSSSEGEDPEEGIDESEHNSRMFVAACVTWHVMGIALFILLVWTGMHVVLRSGIRSRRKGPRLRGQAPKWMDTEEQRSLITSEAVPLSPGKENEIEMQEVGVTAM